MALRGIIGRSSRPTSCHDLARRRDDLAAALGRQVGDNFALLARVAGQLGLGPPAPATSIRDDRDALVWHRVEVGGSTVVYGDGGDGPAVLFLHGWGLGSRSYKRSMRRLTAQGCRVLAPAMPGFGGSAPLRLPPELVDIAAYGHWANDFLDAVGVTEPVLVVGHSFGGGVAIAFAHAHPERARYLVLVNAVGGATWDGRRGRSLADRPLWDWAVEFGREMIPTRAGLDTLGAISEDLVANLLRNPLTLIRAGELARKADLTAELIDLRSAGVPVLALTSERDTVIPAAAFDALCQSVGAAGHVVRGGHSWLLAEPDHFAEVLANVVEVEVGRHRAVSTVDAAAEVVAALAETTVPRDVVDAMLRDAPPLWLMSEHPTELAADLALCHPPLRSGEVRAVARPNLADDRYRLTVVAEDRPGLLADTAAALATRSLSIVSASAITLASDGVAMHSLVIEPAADDGEPDFDALGDDLRSMAHRPPHPDFVPAGRARVRVSGDPARRATVTVTAPDQVGLLWATCRWLTDHGFGIEALHATTRGRWAEDTFIVIGDGPLDDLALSLSARARVPAGA